MKKEDRRVQRTKQALQDALIDLIIEKTYDAISIQEIVDYANVGRSTFYSHYSSKDAVFFDSFKSLEASLKALFEHKKIVPNKLIFTNSLLSHLDKDRKLYAALAGERGGVLAANHMKKILYGLVHSELKIQLIDKNITKKKLDATIHFMVGAIFSTASWWLDNKTGWSFEEVDEFLQSMFKPIFYELSSGKNND